MGVETDLSVSLLPLLEARERERPIRLPIDILRPFIGHPVLSLDGDEPSISTSRSFSCPDRSVEAIDGTLDLRDSLAGLTVAEEAERAPKGDSAGGGGPDEGVESRGS